MDVDVDTVVVTRRARVCALLRDAGVDVLVVGRSVNLACLTGARRVLVRGSRPFAPLAVLVPATGELFVQSATEGGVPAGVAPRVYAQSWNPGNVVRELGAIAELASATRVGVDAMTPGWAARLGELVPRAELVAVDELLRGIRTVKTHDELPVLRRAVGIALVGFAAVADAVRPGVSERELRACFASTVARLGVTTLPHEAVCRVVGDGGTAERLPGDARVRDDDAVAVDVGVVVDGYEAGVARTLRARDRAHASPGWVVLRDAVAAACRPGATGADLDEAARRVAARDDGVPLAYGYGFGPEPPLASEDAVADGTVLAVQARLHDGFGRDMVLVTPTGGRVLTGGADATTRHDVRR